MGFLDMNDTEFDQFKEYYTEAFYMLAQKVKFYPCIAIDYDFHKDPTYTYGEPRSVHVLFKPQPNPKYFNNNWDHNDPLPLVVYINKLDDNYEDLLFKVGSKIELTQRQSETYQSNELYVSSISGHKLNPIYWECKLVPVIEKQKVDYEDPKVEKEDNPTGGGYKFTTRKKPNL